MLDNRVVVQIGTYNANLQGHRGLPQDLVDWLVPSLTVSNFLANSHTAPDIVAIGFQELLPLQLGFAGLSQAVMRSRDELIRSQLEAHTPQKEKYVLVAKVVYVGEALLVYARDDTVAKYISDVQTQWTGCGPGFMGNKGAVGVRFKVTGLYGENDAGEVYTFVNSHLTAHQPRLEDRIEDYKQIVQTLLFPHPQASSVNEHSNMYQTTHLFFFGDLNFRIDPPKGMDRIELESKIRSETGREELIEYDQLRKNRDAGRVLQSLREGEFWRFQCTYKYELGTIDQYHPKRTPSWTDRILFTTSVDDPSDMSTSAISVLAYTPAPSYTGSDHKPVVAILHLPEPRANATSRPFTIIPPHHFSNDPSWRLKRYVGKAAGWCIGWTWCLFWFVGAGSTIVGLVGSVLGMMGVVWWNNPSE